MSLNDYFILSFNPFTTLLTSFRSTSLLALRTVLLTLFPFHMSVYSYLLTDTDWKFKTYYMRVFTCPRIKNEQALSDTICVELIFLFMNYCAVSNNCSRKVLIILIIIKHLTLGNYKVGVSKNIRTISVRKKSPWKILFSKQFCISFTNCPIFIFTFILHTSTNIYNIHINISFKTHK